MASTVVELLFDPIRLFVSRVYNYSRNVKNLETLMEELSDIKTRVLHSVVEATNKTEVIHDDVEKWLANVDDITEEADRVLKDEDKANNRCFMGLFPNLMTRYRVSTEIKSIEEEAVKISLRGKFDRVCYLPARHGIGDRSVKDYEAFESRRHVLDEILEALEDNDVDLVGVYGMAGVGKTTIVKKVAEQVKANRIFDVVVLAVVSKTPNLKTIQGEIADGLGFKFEAETIRGRAEQLRKRLERETKVLERETKVIEREPQVLERETKVLVILDDIWERLELDDVGIPSGSDNQGCKILMTSRDRNALREWPAEDMLEQCSAISLPACKISGLPEVLNCPKLESFILYNEDPSLKIPDCLFKGTKTLQLMDMTDPMILPKNLSVILILTNEMNLMMKQKLCMQIEFPNLEDLKLSSIEVEKIWQDQPGELSYWFLRLTSLIVEGCGNLKSSSTFTVLDEFPTVPRI
uniref:NB-ARC domain-containing protein n=1 Tax=Salix viminalis TaxID=40686 RepID=A0A6N2LPY0_SALVM